MPFYACIDLALRAASSGIAISGIAITCLPLAALLAQPASRDGSLAGTVFVDTSNAKIANAEIIFEKLKLSARSDSAGNFRVTGIPAGSHEFVVRRVGYQPFIAAMRFDAGQKVEADFMLKPLVTTLTEVNVKAAVDARYASRLVDFEERRRFGIGRFLTADVFEKAAGQNLSQVLGRQFPGVQTMGKGSEQILVSIRGQTCAVQVVLNGMSVFNGRQGQAPFDINSLFTANVLGVEYYTVATTPAQFNGTGAKAGGSQCGTVVIWTK